MLTVVLGTVGYFEKVQGVKVIGVDVIGNIGCWDREVKPLNSGVMVGLALGGLIPDRITEVKAVT